jgi:hypothetical protein
VTSTCAVLGDLVSIGDEQYLKARHVVMYPEVGDMKLYSSNLFSGSEELSEYRQLSHFRLSSIFVLLSSLSFSSLFIFLLVSVLTLQFLHLPSSQARITH